MKNRFANTGKITWIGLRRTGRGSILEVASAELLAGHGLVGDKAGQRTGSNRQVTLFQAEHLAVIASFLNKKSIHPGELRRNIVVSGINLGALKGYRIQVQDAVLVIMGDCAPCKKMEQVLGFGGFNAMCNHGGVTAIVEKGGVISISNKVKIWQKSLRKTIYSKPG